MVVPVCQQHRIQIDTAGCNIRSGQAQRRRKILSVYSVPVQRIPVGIQKLLVPGKRPHGAHDGMVIGPGAFQISASLEIRVQIFAGHLKDCFHVQYAVIMGVSPVDCRDFSIRNLDEAFPFRCFQAAIHNLCISCQIQLSQAVPADTGTS